MTAESDGFGLWPEIGFGMVWGLLLNECGTMGPFSQTH